MTYESFDLLNTTPTIRTQIQIIIGDYINVTNTRTVEISPFINLRNCLLISSLTHQLLYVSQLTKELDCIVTMSSTDFVVQDGQTRKIIRRGTKRGGLYNVDEKTHKDQAMFTHGSFDYHLWMWHLRLGHPSLTCLKHLFSSFENTTPYLDCEAYVLAKSHKH